MRKNSVDLIVYELKNGILFKWKKYAPLAVISFFFCVFFFTRTMQISQIKGESAMPVFMDYIIYLFKGMEEYIPESGQPFTVPVIWFVINFYIATVIANYPTNDICGFGRTVLLQHKSRANWFFNKCVWAIASVAVCFLLIYIPPFLISLCTGGLSLTASSGVSILTALEIDCTFLPKGELLVISMLLPFLTSVAVSVIQLALEFILKPVYSYMVIICFWIVSAYFCTPVIFGNNSMIMRSNYFNFNGVRPLTGIIICSVLTAAAAVCGIFYFKRYDIIDKG